MVIRSPHPLSRAAVIVLAISSVLVSSCNLAPNYAKPAVPTPPSYKDVTPAAAQTTPPPAPAPTAPAGQAPAQTQNQNWKQAQPQDAASRGKWWEAFNDSQLNGLEEQLSASNQNIAAAAANFLAARALVREARSQYFPTVIANPSIINARPSPGQLGSFAGGSTSNFAIQPSTDYSLSFDASWQPDLWGRVRNLVNANTFAAQATAADLQNVRLTTQSELAVDYFELRTQDALKQLFDATVSAYQDSLDLIQLQFQAGIASEEAVAQAETQLEATQAEDTNLGIARAQFEDAIAILTGQAAPAFSLAAQTVQATVPAIPPGIPSELLERRPDIAAAERAVAQANAQIGVARAAFYPNITLSAAGGFGGLSPTTWFAWPARFWSVGPALTETLFDAHLRSATVQQYRALYDANVANYRQAVLTAFGQVQDNLAALGVLSKEIQQQDNAVASAQKNQDIAMDRYRAGIDPYLNVITAQTTLLSNQQSAVNLRLQQMTSSVQLIEALGGGWDAAQLPTPQDVRSSSAATPGSTP